MHGVAWAFCCKRYPLCSWHFILTVAPVWISQYPAAKDLFKEKKAHNNIVFLRFSVLFQV